MEDFKFDVIIYGDCDGQCSLVELNILKQNFKSYTIDANSQTYNTYVCHISEDPTYKLISNEYRIPHDKYWNGVYAKQSPVPLDTFLTIEEIKMINYFEYGIEHIHCVIQQGKSDVGISVCSSKDLNFVTNKLISYFENNKILGLQTSAFGELKNLELLSDIALKYEWDIHFYYAL